MVQKILPAYRSFGLPLRLILVVPFVLQIFLAVGLTGFFSFRSGQKAVQELANQLQAEVSLRIQQQIQFHLTAPTLINLLNVSEIQTNQLNPNNLQQLERHFIQLHQIFKQATINHISVGTKMGEYLAVRQTKTQDGFHILVATKTDPGKLRKYLANPKGERTKLLDTTPHYDPRDRPWYQSAARNGQATWSEIYTYFDTTTLGISHTYPWYDDRGELQGVLATDFDLGELGQFLRTTQLGSQGRALILEQDGLLVASSLPESPFHQQNGQTTRINANQSKDPVTAAIARYLKQYPKTVDLAKRDHHLKLGQETYFLRIESLHPSDDLNWLLVVAIPQSNFMREVNQNIFNTIVLCAITLLLSSILGILVCRWISQSIYRLSEVAGAIATGNLAQEIKLDRWTSPRIIELVALTQAFNHMSRQLQASFNALEQTNAELEMRVEQRTSELKQANLELKRLATMDGLTQLANRRFFDEYLQQEWERTLREQQPISLILCDVDYFKNYNDTYGHQAGDVCLQKIANTLTWIARRLTDLVARYGGEEFVVILPNTPHEGAVYVAQRIQSAVRQSQIVHANSQIDDYVTVSLGVASVVPTVDLTPQDLINKADRALYEAKAQGRNRVVAKLDPETSV